MNITIHNPSKLPTIDYRKVEEFQGNLKDLTKDNYDKLKKSIKENGFFIPMFLWKCNGKFKVLDAHQRLRILKREEVTPYEIPYIEIEAKNEKEAKKKLLLISSQYGTITREGLDEFAFDLDIDWMKDTINFDNVFDFDKIKVEEDDYEVPDKIKTDIKLGDLFQLGDHRLLCGDSMNPNNVKRLIKNDCPNLMITDPPYGVNYNADWRNHTGDKSRSGRAIGKVLNDNISCWKDAYALSPSKIAYVWHAAASTHAIQFAIDLIDCDFEIRNQIIWVKNNIVISRGNYHWKHEPCWYAVKKGEKSDWIGGRKQSTIWEIDKPLKSETGHSTQKPIECMARPIKNHKGDVYDPFLGSGTTMIAAEQLNRKCYGMEISPEYCQIIIDRWEKLTNKNAIKI